MYAYETQWTMRHKNVRPHYEFLWFSWEKASKFSCT